MSETEPGMLLKGTQMLPEAISFYEILKARAKEIQALQKSLAQPTGTKLIFQRLPNHMRRRTMSFVVKRLPRRIRQAHLAQMTKSGLPPKTKRPSRRFRRRPKNSMTAYARRHRNNTWMETHIWHAKRFHMINKWGYRLPDRPCDKSFRACYRAGAKHCLLQDISYFQCLGLTGPEEVLINNLKLLQSPNLGLTITAKAYTTGKREGTTILYHPNKFPDRAIGEIKFIWRPVRNLKETNTVKRNRKRSHRQLWIWAHPSFYSELLNCLIDLFSLELNTLTSQNENKDGVRLVKIDLNRFRLTGPLAHSVLKHSLQLPKLETTESKWLKNYLKSPINSKNVDGQFKYWTDLCNIGSTSELSCHIILNLIITDPRFNLPSKRTKAQLENNVCEVPELVDELKFGAIWDNAIRTETSENLLATSEIIQKRASKLVPDNQIPEDASCLPVMLIQQPGNSADHLGYCSGWDIIFPTNWGLPLWLSFIMRGARAGGLRESNLLKFEQGLTDLLVPDTLSGDAEEKYLSALYKEKYFKLPPNKRVNYTKLGIVAPFIHPWATLIGEWNNQKVDSFYVLRDRKMLLNLQNSLTITGSKVLDQQFLENCLVPVRLTLRKRGKVPKFSIICLPQSGDLEQEPNEPLHKDLLQKERRNLRMNHQKELKTFKRRRIRAKDTGKEVPKTDDIVENYASKMRELWLPVPKQIRNSCAREVFGFVTHGDFCYSSGKGGSVGYIALGALTTLFSSNKKNVVLLRSINSRQYRLATMEIICNQI